MLSEHIFRSPYCIKNLFAFLFISGQPLAAKQRGEDEKSYVPYTVGACAFFVGIIAGSLIMILLKKLKGDSPRISQEKYCTQNGYDTGKNTSHFLFFFVNKQYNDNTQQKS